MRPLDLVAALDLERSEITRYPSGRVMMVDSYVFKVGAFQGKHFTKVLETSQSEVLVSDTFKQAVEKAQLQGLQFAYLGEA
jgi:hypothetical protein